MTTASSSFETEWRARFERFAHKYRGEAQISGWSELGLRRRLRLFSSLLPSLGLPRTADVLDLGCGAGTYVRHLAGLGHNVIGIDYSLPSLAHAVLADRTKHGHYLVAEGYALPFGPGAFDLVVSIGVLQVLARPEAALDEMARVLRPDGVLVVEALNGRALSALARHTIDVVRGRPPRVRHYSPLSVQGWLRARGLRLTRRASVWLPPRWWPWAASDVGPLAARLGRHPALALSVAHSFLFVARKGSASVETAR